MTHPINRDDLPFRTLTGLVDADRYCDVFVHFPARWQDPQFKGTLAKGTPVAQCLPVKREIWAEQFETMTPEAAERLREVGDAILEETGVYRRNFAHRSGKASLPASATTAIFWRCSAAARNGRVPQS